MMTLEQIALAEQVINRFEETIAEYDACKEDDYVLSFATGLAIRFDKNNNPVACNLANAEAVATNKMPEEAWAYIPSVKNGGGEVAKVVRRQVAIKKERKDLVRYVAEYKEAVAKAKSAA